MAKVIIQQSARYSLSLAVILSLICLPYTPCGVPQSHVYSAGYRSGMSSWSFHFAMRLFHTINITQEHLVVHLICREELGKGSTCIGSAFYLRLLTEKIMVTAKGRIGDLSYEHNVSAESCEIDPVVSRYSWKAKQVVTQTISLNKNRKVWPIRASAPYSTKFAEGKKKHTRAGHQTTRKQAVQWE